MNFAAFSFGPCFAFTYTFTISIIENDP